MLNSHLQTRRPLARTLAIGVPWLAVVGLLAGAEYVRNEGTLTRGLLQLFSGSCPSQVAGIDLSDCEQLEPHPDFPFESDPECLVFATGKFERFEAFETSSNPLVHVAPPALPARLERSQDALMAIEAAQIEAGRALAIARSSWREAQDARSSTTYVLRRSDSRSGAQPPVATVRVSTDG